MADEEGIVIDILNNEIDLDNPCWNCTECGRSNWRGGPSQIYSIKEEYKNGKECSFCDNKRFILSSAGEAIMKLIKRHG